MGHILINLATDPHELTQTFTLGLLGQDQIVNPSDYKTNRFISALG
jgi:hypothetical protein